MAPSIAGCIGLLSVSGIVPTGLSPALPVACLSITTDPLGVGDSSPDIRGRASFEGGAHGCATHEF